MIGNLTRFRKCSEIWRAFGNFR